MKYQNIVAYGSIIAGLLGCEENTNKQNQDPILRVAFANVPMTYETGMALTNGDFDGDGDLDLIVGSLTCYSYTDTNCGNLYLFLNDGKGNFTLKEPAKK